MIPPPLRGKVGVGGQEIIVESIIEFVQSLAPGQLLEDPRTPPGEAYLVLLALFAVSFLAGLAFTLAPGRISTNRVSRRMVERYSAWAVWLGAAGLLAVLLRHANVPLFSKRLWAALDLAALVAVAVHLVWYRVRRYPGELAEYREEQRRRRFIPPPRPAATRPGRRRRR